MRVPLLHLNSTIELRKTCFLCRIRENGGQQAVQPKPGAPRTEQACSSIRGNGQHPLAPATSQRQAHDGFARCVLHRDSKTTTRLDSAQGPPGRSFQHATSMHGCLFTPAQCTVAHCAAYFCVQNAQLSQGAACDAPGTLLRCARYSAPVVAALCHPRRSRCRAREPRTQTPAWGEPQLPL